MLLLWHNIIIYYLERGEKCSPQLRRYKFFRRCRRYFSTENFAVMLSFHSRPRVKLIVTLFLRTFLLWHFWSDLIFPTTYITFLSLHFIPSLVIIIKEFNNQISNLNILNIKKKKNCGRTFQRKINIKYM